MAAITVRVPIAKFHICHTWSDDRVHFDFPLAPSATVSEVIRELSKPEILGIQSLWSWKLVQGSTLVFPTTPIGSLEVDDDGVALLEFKGYTFKNEAEQNRFLEAWTTMFLGKK